MRQYTKHNINSGFTLIELSVVLLIIAILISGITFATNLITQTKIKRTVVELNNYQLMVDRFVDQYGSIPGDFTGAFDIWGADCATSASLCNGNGNGVIDWQSGNSNEALMAWKHLGLAGFINTLYSGITSGADQSLIGVNIPKLQGWSAIGVEFYTQATQPSGIGGIAVQLAGQTQGSWAKTPVFTPNEALALDLKIDDGLGNTGTLQGFDLGTTSSCVSASGTYNTNLKSAVCYLRYYLLTN